MIYISMGQCELEAEYDRLMDLAASLNRFTAECQRAMSDAVRVLELIRRVQEAA